MFLILFYVIFRVETGLILSRKRKIFQWKTSFCQFSNMASLGLRKMLTFIIFNTMVSNVGENVNLHKFQQCGVRHWCDGTICNGRCYDHCDCRQMVHILLWQMLLPIKIMKVNIFLRPKEAMLENWQKFFFPREIFFCFLTKMNLFQLQKYTVYFSPLFF